MWNEARSAADADFFTVGYTGRSLQEILDAIVTAGATSLIDIRHMPVSMYRPELSKQNLQQAVEERGLAYFHARDLGVPREIRAMAADSGTRDTIWTWYDENVVTPKIGKNLHWFWNFFEHPVALMCVEIDPQECHRHRLSLALEKRGMRGFDI